VYLVQDANRKLFSLDFGLNPNITVRGADTVSLIVRGWPATEFRFAGVRSALEIRPSCGGAGRIFVQYFSREADTTIDDAVSSITCLVFPRPRAVPSP
jgi:hypothetical protein